jgi:hypothetical protein
MAEVQEFEEEVGELEAVAEKVEQQESKKPDVAPEDDLPDEFKGKSIKDLVGITLHARKEMGRQANELGEIRKLADELIKSQLQKPKEAEQPKEVDFFENPEEAIRRAVEANPKVQAAEAYAVNAQRQLAKQQLQQMHPDSMQIISDPEFRKWVTASPVRQDLLQRADQGYDLLAAHELLSTYKEIRQVKQQVQQKQMTEVEKTAQTQALKSVAVDTGGSGETTRKIYRRADLIRLKMNDPARYEAMNDEILQAYADGRVR